MKLQGMAICDLRKYKTAEALSSIKSIEDVAALIVPKNPSDEWSEAFGKIKMSGIAAVISLEGGAEVGTINGDANLHSSDIPAGESFFTVNGDAFIYPLDDNQHISLIVNGTVYNDISNDGKVTFLVVNGEQKTLDLRTVIRLPDEAVLTNDSFSGDKANNYIVGSHAVIHEVEPSAVGSITTGMLVAHESVKKSQIDASAIIVYTDKDTPVVFRKNMLKLEITAEYLNAIKGRLFLKNVGKIKIAKDVEPELIKEKILHIRNAGTIKCGGKNYVAVQNCTVGSGAVKK